MRMVSIMKKIIFFQIVIIIVLLFAGCISDSKEKKENVTSELSEDNLTDNIPIQRRKIRVLNKK